MDITGGHGGLSPVKGTCSYKGSYSFLFHALTTLPTLLRLSVYVCISTVRVYSSPQGALEMIAAVGLGNVVYSLTAGQPLVILGGTGPTLIFEDIVYKFSQQNDVPYLNFRFWIGMWVSLFMLALVAFNASAMMRLFTRFTEEIFSALISFIFIYEAFDKVWKINVEYSYSEWILKPTVRRECNCYEFSSNETLAAGDLTNATKITYFWDDPNVNCTEELQRKLVGKNCDGLHPDVFLMSVILFFGTFLLSFYLKKVRGSSFFSAIVSSCHCSWQRAMLQACIYMYSTCTNNVCVSMH